MYWPKTKQTTNEGVLFLGSVINTEGSIFHPIHQENDVGVDGFIEFVSKEKASGRLVAVQIKSGDSYLNDNEKEFVISVDQRHLEYWESYTLPVILVCYSPRLKVSAWISIRDYIEGQKYHDKVPINQIHVHLYRQFTKDTLKEVAALAHFRADERFLVKNADKCLSSDAQKRREGFSILRSHPDSRFLKLTIFFARQFLFDEDINVAKAALFTIARGAGGIRWSWNTNNSDELERIAYAQGLCEDLNEKEIRRIIELVDGEGWEGPDGLVERALDIVAFCVNTALPILHNIFRDSTQPLIRRVNALFLISEGDDEILEENLKYYGKSMKYREVCAQIIPPSQRELLYWTLPAKKKPRSKKFKCIGSKQTVLYPSIFPNNN